MVLKVTRVQLVFKELLEHKEIKVQLDSKVTKDRQVFKEHLEHKVTKVQLVFKEL
jgi:hypothetical protein